MKPPGDEDIQKLFPVAREFVQVITGHKLDN
jgi:hypothetical protein